MIDIQALLAIESSLIDHFLHVVDDGLRELAARRSDAADHCQDFANEREVNGQVDDRVVGFLQELTQRVEESVFGMSLTIHNSIERTFANYLRLRLNCNKLEIFEMDK